VSRNAVAVDAALELQAGTDPRAPGGAVTVELCGHWEHDGPCRWPHTSRIDTDSTPARLRTVVVVSDEDRADVLRRIEVALRSDDRWQVVSVDAGAIAAAEQALADRLARNRSEGRS